MNVLLKSLLVFLGVVALAVLFFPLPHGGSIGAGILHEMTDAISDFAQKSTENKNQIAGNKLAKDTLYKKLSGRFKAAIDVSHGVYPGGWAMVEVSNSQGWLDKKTGLIWGVRQKLVLDSWGNEQLSLAIGYCQQLAPEGHWSLPTNSEFALGIKHKMQDTIEDMRGKWIAQSYSSDSPSLEPIPTLVGFSNQGINQISVRCVARTDKAPAHGYIRDDITNEDILGMMNR